MLKSTNKENSEKKNENYRPRRRKSYKNLAGEEEGNIKRLRMTGEES